MNARIIKETRALLPAFWTTVGVTLAVSLFWRGESALVGVTVLFCICCTLMGASCFGNEFSHQTMPLLLVQPVSRRTIWREKMLVLGVAVVLALAALFACIGLFTDRESFGGDFWLQILTLALICAGIVFTAPRMTLWTRNTLTGALWVFGFPLAFVLFFVALAAILNLEGFLQSHKPFIEANQHPFLLNLIRTVDMHRGLQISLQIAAYSFIPTVYFVLSYFSGRSRFMNFQAVDSRATDLSLPAKMEAALVWPFKRFLPGYTGTIASLFRKELQLQRPSFIIAGLICLVAPLEAVIEKLHPSEFMAAMLVLNVVMCILIIPLVAIGISVAEERSLGVAGWQQVLPPSTRRQWLIKLCVTLVTCVLLGLVLPYIMTAIGVGLNLFSAGHVHVAGSASWGLPSPVVLVEGLAWLLFLALGIFASSVSTVTFRAILANLGLLAGASSMVVWSNHLVYWGMNSWRAGLITNFINEPELAWAPRPAITPVLLVLALMLACLVALVHGLARANYRNGQPGARRAWTQTVIILAAFGVAATVVWYLLFAWLDPVSRPQPGIHMSQNAAARRAGSPKV